MHADKSLDLVASPRRGRTDPEKAAQVIANRDVDLAKMPKVMKRAGLTLESSHAYHWRYTAREVCDLATMRVSPEMSEPCDFSIDTWQRIKRYDRKFEQLDAYRQSPLSDRNLVDAYFATLGMLAEGEVDALLALPGTSGFSDADWIAVFQMVQLYGLAVVTSVLADWDDTDWVIAHWSQHPRIQSLRAAYDIYLLDFAPCVRCGSALGLKGQRGCPFDAEIKGIDHPCNCCSRCRQHCSDEI